MFFDVVLEKSGSGQRSGIGEEYTHGSVPCNIVRHCAGGVFVPGYGACCYVGPPLVLVFFPSFSVYGLCALCSAASETENPRRNIAKAVRRVFYRIVVFYVRPPPSPSHSHMK
jgi:amino acid permease